MLLWGAVDSSLESVIGTPGRTASKSCLYDSSYSSSGACEKEETSEEPSRSFTPKVAPSFVFLAMLMTNFWRPFARSSLERVDSIGLTPGITPREEEALCFDSSSALP